MRTLDREIFGLAAPALGALVAEPLFLLTDTALIGHLGEVPLAALSVASVILQTAIGLLIFLAYATTPLVARHLGSGRRRDAVRAGIDGMWLALVLGCVLAAVGVPTAAPLVQAFGVSSDVASAASLYLVISLAGVPAMLLVIAAAGLLRGLQDTRTPLVVAVLGFAANAALNAVLIYGLGWGVAGSAAGTVVAQWGMAGVYLVIAVRAARRVGAPLHPGFGGVLATAASGGWLFLRTLSLRAAMLGTVWVIALFSIAELAAFQIGLTVFVTLAFVLDSLAIAAQALVGHSLGVGDAVRVRAVARRLMQFGVIGGVLVGAVLALVAPLLGFVFTSSEEIRDILTLVLWTMAAGMPLAGFVFVLDGVLIGAGDSRYLAWTGVVNLACYLPALVAVALLRPDVPWGALALWVAFGFGYVGARAVTLGIRARGSAWIRRYIPFEA